MCSLFSTNSMFISERNVLIILLLVSWLRRKKYVPDVHCFNLLHNTVKSLVVFIVNTSYSCKQMASMNPTCILGILFFFSRFIRSWKHRNTHTQICIYLIPVGSETLNPWVSWGRPDTCLPASSPSGGSYPPAPNHAQEGPGPLSLIHWGCDCPCVTPRTRTDHWPQINWWPRVRHWPRVHCWHVSGEQTCFLIVYWCGIKHSQLCERCHWGHSRLQLSSHRELSEWKVRRYHCCFFSGAHDGIRQSQHLWGEQRVYLSACLKWSRFSVSCDHHSATHHFLRGFRASNKPITVCVFSH